jgi:threonine aldolase
MKTLFLSGHGIDLHVDGGRLMTKMTDEQFKLDIIFASQ